MIVRRDQFNGGQLQPVYFAQITLTPGSLADALAGRNGLLHCAPGDFLAAATDRFVHAGEVIHGD
jgi:hypothetical protein